MILHICNSDKKFIKPFIELVNKELQSGSHQFLVYGGDEKEYPREEYPNVEQWPFLFSLRQNYFLGFKSVKRFLKLAAHSEKIILHSLWDGYLVKLLAFFPKLIKKCCWVIWGADLYYYKFRKKSFKSNIHEFFRRIVIKRLGFLVTGTKGNLDIVKSIYKSKGKWIKSFVYTSNVFDCHCFPTVKKNNAQLNILIGNSADPTNNQEEIFEKLLKFKNRFFYLHCPLSYGDKEHAQKITKLGLSHFGDRFNPILNFWPNNDYLKFLKTIDIAIFAHKRQQAFGNTLMLLGLGKKVFYSEGINLVGTIA